MNLLKDVIVGKLVELIVILEQQPHSQTASLQALVV